MAHIFKNLAAQPYTERTSLCLICKAFLPAARHILYHNVSILQVVSQNPSSLPGEHTVTERSTLFLRTLTSLDLPPQQFGKIILDISEPHRAPSWGLRSPLDFQLLDEVRGAQVKEIMCRIPCAWLHGKACLQFLQQLPIRCSTAFWIAPDTRSDASLECLWINRNPASCTSSMAVAVQGASVEPGAIMVWGSANHLAAVLSAMRCRVGEVILFSGTTRPSKAILSTFRDMPALQHLKFALSAGIPIAIQVHDILDAAAHNLQHAQIRCLTISCTIPCRPSLLINLVHGLSLPALDIIKFHWRLSAVQEVEAEDVAQETRAFCNGSSQTYRTFRDTLATSGTALQAVLLHQVAESLVAIWPLTSGD